MAERWNLSGNEINSDGGQRVAVIYTNSYDGRLAAAAPRLRDALRGLLDCFKLSDKVGRAAAVFEAASEALEALEDCKPTAEDKILHVVKGED